MWPGHESHVLHLTQPEAVGALCQLACVLVQHHLQDGVAVGGRHLVQQVGVPEALGADDEADGVFFGQTMLRSPGPSTALAPYTATTTVSRAGKVYLPSSRLM